MLGRGRCRACRAHMFWAKTAATGVPMPVDPEPDFGRIAIDVHNRAHVFGSHAEAVARMDSEPDLFLTETFVPHHAVCPERRDNVERQHAAEAQQQLL